MGTSQSTVVGRAVILDGSRSWDPDGDQVSGYRWDFGDGKKDDGRVHETSVLQGRDIHGDADGD